MTKLSMYLFLLIVLMTILSCKSNDENNDVSFNPGEFIIPEVLGTAYYVDATNGDDSNNGLSHEHAFKTISKINSMNFEPGDGILFKRGEVFNEMLHIPSAGIANNNIIIGDYGYENYSAPMIDLENSNIAAILCNQSYITIRNLILKNSAGNGLEIEVTGGAYGIEIRNVTIYDSANNGIIIVQGGDDVLITNTRIYNSGNNGIGLWGSPANKLSHVIVENCYISKTLTNDCITIHVDAENNSAGSNFIIRNNYTEYCAEQGFDISTGTNILLKNNTSFNNYEGGIVVSDESGSGASDVTIQNHTSYGEPGIENYRAIYINASNVQLL